MFEKIRNEIAERQAELEIKREEEHKQALVEAEKRALAERARKEEQARVDLQKLEEEKDVLREYDEKELIITMLIEQRKISNRLASIEKKISEFDDMRFYYSNEIYSLKSDIDSIKYSVSNLETQIISY